MMPPIPSDLKCLAVEMPSWIGDSVMATPVLRAARQHCAEARIVGLMRPGLDALLRGLPFLDELVTVDPRGVSGVRRTVRALKSVNAGAALLLPNSFRSAVAARMGGVRRRVGYARDGRGFLLTHRLARDRRERPISQIDYYTRLACFAFGVDSIDQAPTLSVTDDERVWAAQLLDGTEAPFVLLNPGGNKLAKRWPPERFVATAKHLKQSHGLMAVVNGSPGERNLVCGVTESIGGGAIDLVERGVSLGPLKGVIDRAALVITNDTGPRHIAAALGRPIVSLFGPTDHRWTRLHLPFERVLLAEPFLPDELVADDHPTMCAIDRIPVSDVVFAAEVLLRGDQAR